MTVYAATVQPDLGSWHDVNHSAPPRTMIPAVETVEANPWTVGCWLMSVKWARPRQIRAANQNGCVRMAQMRGTCLYGMRPVMTFPPDVHRVVPDAAQEARTTKTYPLTPRGLHKVACPSCGGYNHETKSEPATPAFDPNVKTCERCGYMWQQVAPELRDGGKTVTKVVLTAPQRAAMWKILEGFGNDVSARVLDNLETKGMIRWDIGLRGRLTCRLTVSGANRLGFTTGPCRPTWDTEDGRKWIMDQIAAVAKIREGEPEYRQVPPLEDEG